MDVLLGLLFLNNDYLVYRKPLTMHEPARCRGGRRGGRDVSMRDETVFGITNSPYHANPSSDRVFFRRQCNDLTFPWRAVAHY